MLVALPAGAAAQEATAWVDAAATSTRPPAGMAGQTTLYGLFGGRLRVDTRDAGGLDAFVRGGRGGGPSPSSWTEGQAAWELGGAGHGLAWGVRTSAFALDYRQPFGYRALGATVEPRLSSMFGANLVTVRGDLRRGSWSLGAPPLAVDTIAAGALALTGGSITLGRLIGSAWIEAGAESYRGAFDGWFTGGVASATVSRGALDLGLLGRAWSTPVGSQLGLSATAAYSVSDAASVRLEVGRTTTDPLYGSPGSFGISLGVGLRVGTLQLRVPRARAVELTGPAGDGRRARFRLHAPHARTVAVAGDFTDWRPRPMTRTGSDWLVELTVPTGVHHFAFLVNGQNWVVPADAPGVAADDWGRKNATLVVDP